MSSTSNCFPLVVVIINALFLQCSIVSSENNPPTPIPCSSFNASALRVVTFDLFGALMLTESSLQDNVRALIPSLSSTNVAKFVDLWLDAYVSYFGKSFLPSVTHQPFQWVINSSLVQILKSFGLSERIPENSTTFNALMASWGNLKPRPDVIDVLTKLTGKYQLGLLSNGDHGTLQSALRIFPSSVNVSLVFSSDYPTNCFKTCSAMYAQALDAVHGDLNQVLHVGGSKYDATGARTFGIYSGAIDPSPASAKDPQPCFVFNTIKQLLSILDV